MSTDNQKTELALQAMKHALQAIANYGDCLHDEDGGAGQPDCQCPVHTAKRALVTEDAVDWRFSSHMDFRRNTMPRERDIVDAFRDYLKRQGGGSPDVKLSQIIGDDPSVRDWYVAVSVVQWLATNCGMSVLDRAGFRYDWNRKRSS